MISANAERDYRLIALAALLLLYLLLTQQNLELWGVLPLALGALGLFVPGTVSPPFVLGVVLTLLVFQPQLASGFPGWMRQRTSAVEDLLLAAALLGYLIAHTRLLTLLRHAVPPDTRRARKPEHDRLRGRWLLPSKATRRSAASVPPRELPALLLSVPLFALVAYLLWIRIGVETPPETLQISPFLWRALLVVWGGGVTLVAVYALIAYLGRAQAGLDESLGYLQDQLWAATRGEQRQIQSWSVWARLHRERKEQS